MPDLKAHINYEPWNGVVSLTFSDSFSDGVRRVAEPIKFVEIPRNEIATVPLPTMHLQPDEAQRVVNEFARVGIRPADPGGNEGVLDALRDHIKTLQGSAADAMREHIRDLRNVAFPKQDVRLLEERSADDWVSTHGVGSIVMNIAAAVSESYVATGAQRIPREDLVEIVREALREVR